MFTSWLTNVAWPRKKIAKIQKNATLVCGWGKTFQWPCIQGKKEKRKSLLLPPRIINVSSLIYNLPPVGLWSVRDPRPKCSAFPVQRSAHFGALLLLASLEVHCTSLDVYCTSHEVRSTEYTLVWLGNSLDVLVYHYSSLLVKYIALRMT